MLKRDKRENKIWTQRGRYARAKLMDWNDHVDKIILIFDELTETYPKDPAGPIVEFYRSHTELHRTIPLAEA